jgi:hypothetical protein
MAARNKPAGIRSLVYGVGKGKGGIESLSVSACLNRCVCVPIYRYQAGFGRKTLNDGEL